MVVEHCSAGQMKWTSDCEKALEQAAAGSKTATKKLYKKWISYLNKLTAMTRVKLRVIDRNKVVSMAQFIFSIQNSIS